MPSETGARRGSALIEVMVGLVVLAIGGTALITLLGQTAHSMRTTLRREQLVRGASDEMNRIVALPRKELLARVGRHVADGWSVDVSLETPSLFAVSIAESDTSARLVHTTLYRPPLDSADAR